MPVNNGNCNYRGFVKLCTYTGFNTDTENYLRNIPSTRVEGAKKPLRIVLRQRISQ
jgi:hypothetical protein